MKAEKARSSKYLKKEKVAYFEIDEFEQIYDIDCVEESEVNLTELKPGPPYVCKLLKPSNGKNFVRIFGFWIFTEVRIFFKLILDQFFILYNTFTFYNK